MYISILINYIEECNSMSVMPTFKGLICFKESKEIAYEE